MPSMLIIWKLYDKIFVTETKKFQILKLAITMQLKSELSDRLFFNSIQAFLKVPIHSNILKENSVSWFFHRYVNENLS